MPSLRNISNSKMCFIQFTLNWRFLLFRLVFCPLTEILLHNIGMQPRHELTQEKIVHDQYFEVRSAETHFIRASLQLRPNSSAFSTSSKKKCSRLNLAKLTSYNLGLNSNFYVFISKTNCVSCLFNCIDLTFNLLALPGLNNATKLYNYTSSAVLSRMSFSYWLGESLSIL